MASSPACSSARTATLGQRPLSLGRRAGCQFTFYGPALALPLEPGLGLVELAYMVGLACACSVMHASASSGRSRREEAPLPPYLIYHCPSLYLHDPGLYT